MNELSDSIAWPSRDPGWVGKVVLIGLISLVPIAGQLALLGWMLAAVDNLRAGSPVLPPARFSYMGRGGNLFIVVLAYGLGLGVLCGLLSGVGIGIALSAASDGGSAAGVLLILMSYAALILLGLALALITPAIIVATERGGIGGGLNLPAVIRMVGSNPEESMRAGLFALASYLIGGLGSIACLIGQAFTAPYGYAVLAGVVHHYERTMLPMAGPVTVA